MRDLEINVKIRRLAWDYYPKEIPMNKIDKLLDKERAKTIEAVLAALPEGIDGGDYYEQDFAGGWNHCLNEVEQAIKGVGDG